MVGKKDTLVPAKCPNCQHLSRYWLRNLQTNNAQCHLCESFLTESNIIVGIDLPRVSD